MANFYEAGGWGMYPTTLFGVLLIAAAVAYAAMPERRFVPLLVTMSIVTFGSGCLGCVTGFVTTFNYVSTKVPPADQHTVVLAGISESLNNVVLAFVFLVLAALIASVGALRLGLSSKQAAANP
jgi:hypothetical protein